MKILMLGTYPITKPRHGGQLRVKAIVDAYQAAGHDVSYVAITHEGWYDDLGENDIIIDNYELLNSHNKASYDMAIAKFVRRERSLQKKIQALIERYCPDIIQFEQLFSFVATEPVLKALNREFKIVYSSHNIEYQMREVILSAENLNIAEKRKTIAGIRHHEQHLSKVASLVVACTKSDEEELSRLGAKKIVVAQNGIHERNLQAYNEAQWKKRFTDSGVSQVVLFVGSAHPPNLSGFVKLVGTDIGFLPRNARIVIAGSVCRILDLYLNEQPPHVESAFKLRVDMLGEVSEDDMASLVDLSSTIILPITEGGGSNLKTAEAILSGKPVVTTHTAFRGYENYKSMPQIFFADTKQEFRSAILAATEYNLKHKLHEKNFDLKGVTWTATLKDLLVSVNQLEEAMNHGKTAYIN